MFFKDRFPMAGSGQSLHPIQAGQNILDLIHQKRIASFHLCVDRAAKVSVRTVPDNGSCGELRGEKGQDGQYRFEFSSYMQNMSGDCYGNITEIKLDSDAQFCITYGFTVG